MMERTRENWPEAEVHRLRGTLLLGMQDTAGAEKSLHRALEVARQQSARSWELRAALALAHLWRGEDRGREAHALLAPVYGWFTEGFDIVDLKEAKALLQELV